MDRAPVVISGVFSFADLREWLKSFPEQAMGNTGPFTEGGQPYKEFFSVSFARPNDVSLIESIVASDMRHRLELYFGNQRGRIHWRVPLESEAIPAHVVLRYDDNGPDTDYVIAKRCHTDKDWVRVACYCRLYYEQASEEAHGFEGGIVPDKWVGMVT